jgi:predicted TIM-barrel fold metal-dependent hydrolase
MILDYETYWRENGAYGNLDMLVKLFDEVSKDYRAVIFPPATIYPKNREMFKALRAYPASSRFIACAFINPTIKTALQELDIAIRKYCYKGLKLMPRIHRYNVDSLLLDPIIEKAREFRIPVTIHSSDEGGYPWQIEKLAERFPDIPIIMDHAGYRSYQIEAIEAAKRRGNLYLGTSLITEPRSIERMVSEVGADRVVFGSNADTGIPRIGVLVFEYTRLSQMEKDLILGKNLARLLNL